MCIICHAAKKRHITREEVLECMKINSSGFFMCALRPDGTRDTIRTLDEKEAIKFFDDKVKDEDAFVMHARIPSRGEKTLANVHGWEEDGILFMHNMTITEVDSMMRRVKWDNTDSEFFFRKIFIPFYRGLGDEAYKDGKFHEDLDNIIQHFAGSSNKFCFIMPDNVVIRYGTWVSEPDRKEDGKIAFYASNSGYRVYSHTWKGGTAANTAGFCDDEDEYGEYSDYYGYGYGCGWYGEGYRNRRKSRYGKGKAKKTKEFDGKALLKLAGYKGLCQIALTHLVALNAIECRAIYSENEKEKEKIADVLHTMLPKCMGKKNLDKIKEAVKEMLDRYKEFLDNDSDIILAAQTAAQEFCDKAAEIYEEDIVKEYSQYAVLANEYNVKSGLEMVVERTNIVLRIINVHVDFKSLEPDCFATGFVLSKDGWSMEEFMLEDLLDIADMPAEETAEAVRILLAECNDNFALVDDPYLEEPRAGGTGVAEDDRHSEPTLEELEGMEAELYGDADMPDEPDVEDAVGGTVDNAGTADDAADDAGAEQEKGAT